MTISIHIVFRLVDFGTEQCAVMRACVYAKLNNILYCPRPGQQKIEWLDPNICEMHCQTHTIDRL